MAVSNATQTSSINQVQQNNNDPNVGQNTAGKGVLGNNGPTPTVDNQPGYTAMMQSLAAMVPNMNGPMIELFLAEITAKMKDVEENANTERYKNDQEAKRSSLAEKKEKLDEADKKIQESIDAKNSGNIFEIIKMVFQAIAAALMAVLGALLACVPGLQAVGGLMIAAAVVSVIMLVDSAVQQATGMGIVGNCMKAAGCSPEECAKGDMGFRIGMAIVGLALAIATAVVSGGSSVVSAVASLSSAIGAFKTAATMINTGLSIASAATDIVTTGIRTDAAVDSADAKKLQAQAKEMEALLAQLDDFIDMALSRLIGASNRFNEILDAITDMMQSHAQSMSNAKFTA